MNKEEIKKRLSEIKKGFSKETVFNFNPEIHKLEQSNFGWFYVDKRHSIKWKCSTFEAYALIFQYELKKEGNFYSKITKKQNGK